MKQLIPILILLFQVEAFSADNKGLDIAKKMDVQDNGFHDVKANLKMILKDRQGRESTREIRSQVLEVKNDGDKSLIIFDSPRTVQGTKFLSFTHKTGPDDQWLYLPKLKRVKRIASNNKSGPFMASEFAYEDISSQEVEKYKYKFMKEEKCGADTCYIITRFPVDKSSGYSKQLTWITKGEGNLKVHKVKFYDVKGAHLKTLVNSGYKKYLSKYWRPSKMQMDNHITGKSTTLLWSDYEFKAGLNERDFDKSALKRLR
jgi:outer membrane lipoprotein-sorting protein